MLSSRTTKFKLKFKKILNKSEGILNFYYSKIKSAKSKKSQ